ncbi:MAG: NAD(+)/NADH kinase [Cyanobacteria bacterium REEB65]|nr:NAD(+)/NADH kinase [Cyanobacteria bacterium REEB65]
MGQGIVAVIFNERDPAAVSRADEIVMRRKHLLVVPSTQPELPEVDLLVVLGGDGTFLRGARLVAPHGTPILGVDMGTLGFLAEIPPRELESALDQIDRGEFEIEERTMLAVEARRNGQLLASGHGLNDVVVAKGHSGRMVEFSVEMDRTCIASYSADGFIVATPTGSTAYALAAGGPILAPDLEAFVLVPICPHALTARPLVVSDQRTVHIQVRSRSAEALLAVDGVTLGDLQAQDEVLVSRAPYSTRLVRLRAHDFFKRLSKKLQWGGRGARLEALDSDA